MEEIPLPEGSGSLVIVEAPTGSGKTEAALRHLFRLYSAGHVDGFYFALPRRSAASQLHGRAYGYISRTFALTLDVSSPQGPDSPGGASSTETAWPPVILAVPGYLTVDGFQGRRLPGFEVLWPDVGATRHRAWAAEGPKRYLASAIVVGTIDQVLLGALTVSHAHLRGTSLLRNLLIVDEVHASDIYMTTLLEQVVMQQVESGRHVVLMSATLGSSARDRYLSHARRSLGQVAGAGLSSSCDGAHLPYPLIEWVSSGHAGRLEVDTERFSPEVARQIYSELQPWMEDVGPPACRALEKGASGSAAWAGLTVYERSETLRSRAAPSRVVASSMTNLSFRDSARVNSRKRSIRLHALQQAALAVIDPGQPVLRPQKCYRQRNESRRPGTTAWRGRA